MTAGTCSFGSRCPHVSLVSFSSPDTGSLFFQAFKIPTLYNGSFLDMGPALPSLSFRGRRFYDTRLLVTFLEVSIINDTRMRLILMVFTGFSGPFLTDAVRGKGK